MHALFASSLRCQCNQKNQSLGHAASKLGGFRVYLNLADMRASLWRDSPPRIADLPWSPNLISLTSRGLPKAGEPSLISQLSMARHAEHGHQEVDAVFDVS